MSEADFGWKFVEALEEWLLSRNLALRNSHVNNSVEGA